MSERDHIQEFIDLVDRLEKRYTGSEFKYVDSFLMPREMVKAVRDELQMPRLPLKLPLTEEVEK